MASQQETNTMANNATETVTGNAPAMVSLTAKYSNRVLVKSIVERDDGGVGLIGERLVIGGWVKASKEVKKELVTPAPAPKTADHDAAEMALSPSRKEKDVTCVEILQSRIPFFRTIIRVLSGGAGGGSTNTIREKLEAVLPKPPPPSTLFLKISDGSSVAAFQVVVESALASPDRLLPTGTCVLAEGVLDHSSYQGKHVVELKVEKILHIGTVDHDKYILSRKRLPLDKLRDSAHFRPRTTTVASVMRIRSSLTIATHTFFQNNGFLYVQVPIITVTDAEGFSEKFQVTTCLEKADKEEPNATKEVEGVSLDNIKVAIKEKSNQVEELKRSESNKEALATALQDLRKTHELASQLEAKEKTKPVPSIKVDKINISEDFFSRQTYLTVSGHLHLESYACALGNVYSFGPRFRAEKKESAKQVAEMWTAEAEIAFSQLKDAMKCADDFFKFLCTWIVEKCGRDMEFIFGRIDKTSIERLQSMMSCSIEKITYTEAVRALEKVTEKIFEAKLEWGVALTAEHLSYLADEIYKSPVIIYNYPKEVKPFYVRLNADGKTVAAFDMVAPKVGKLITGSQNEERINKLNTRIEELGLPKEQYEWYLDLRRHGTVKHSGFSLGFDLMVLFITGLTDVKDAIPFPRSLGEANN